MIGHIVNKVPPSNYRLFITVYGIGRMGTISLSNFQEKVCLYWKNNFKGAHKETEVSMSVRREKKFKPGRHYATCDVNQDQQNFLNMFHAFMSFKSGGQAHAIGNSIERRLPECTNCGRSGHTRETVGQTEEV